MENLITTLTVGFWFGANTPTEGDNIFVTTFDAENLLEEYNRFNEVYKEFKEKNTNNPVPYKTYLENEECFIYFPEPVGTKLTTFMEVKLMAEFLYESSETISKKRKETEEEIEALEEMKSKIEELRSQISKKIF